MGVSAGAGAGKQRPPVLHRAFEQAGVRELGQAAGKEHTLHHRTTPVTHPIVDAVTALLVMALASKERARNVPAADWVGWAWVDHSEAETVV